MKFANIKTINASNLKGKFLVSYPNIADSRFFKTVIYVTSHNKDGAEGLIINKRSAFSFLKLASNINNIQHELANIKQESFKDLIVLRGGPVNNDQIFILHSSDYKNPLTIPINKTIQCSKNLDIIVDILHNKRPKKLSTFIGNCTWNAGMLEQEIRRSIWMVYTSPTDKESADIVFSKSLEQTWKNLFEAIGLKHTNSSFFL